MATMPSPSPRLRHYRTMTAICFVCNLPILSHQVGLVWQGGNGWDDLMRGQEEENTIRQRLGGRRDSATQISQISPPNEIRETSPPPQSRRRRSSLAQLTDILRDWTGGSEAKGTRKDAQLHRRETLGDIAKSLPWPRSTDSAAALRKRRESSADNQATRIFASGRKYRGSSVKARRESQSSGFSDFRSDLARLWSSRRDSVLHGVPREINAPMRKQQEEKKLREKQKRVARRESLAQQRDACTQDDGPSVSSIGEDVAVAPGQASGGRRGSGASVGSKNNRRGSGEYSRRDSIVSPKSKGAGGRRDSTDRPVMVPTVVPPPVPPRESAVQAQRPHEHHQHQQQHRTIETSTHATETMLPCPTIITSSVTPPQATSPASTSTSPAPTSTVAFQLPVTSVSEGLRGPSSPGHHAPGHPGHHAAAGPSTPGSTTPARGPSPATTPTAPLSPVRPSSMHPQLSSTRRDSTTQVYTSKPGRRDSRAHASPERRHSRDGRDGRDQHSPVRFPRLRRQSTAIDDSCLPPGVWGEGEGGRQARRDSLSPDSASYQRPAAASASRRDSRSHLSPDRAGAGSRDVSPARSLSGSVAP